MTRIKKDKIKNIKKGFSIMEAVISVFVVAVGLTATVSLIVSGLNHSIDSRNYIIASQLAQEGVELVRNLRDNNWAVGNVSFDNSASGNFPVGAGDWDNCRIDKNDTDVKSCNNGADHKKLYYNGNNFYVHTAGAATKFQRKIELDFDTDDAATANNLTVTSIVIWGSDFPAALADCNVSNKCVYAQSVLTRWGE